MNWSPNNPLGVDNPLQIDEEVTTALEEGRGVVALESTLIAHGLPQGENQVVAKKLEQIVRDGGAVPATIAVVDGVARIGLDEEGLERISVGGKDVLKLSIRDLPAVLGSERTGATTVSSTAHLAAMAGITVFATGGLGGVHRDARESWDESADLQALSRTPIVVVSAGVKSILDVTATLERLETLGVTVLGYDTDTFPGFYLHSSGHPLDWSVESPEEIVRIIHAGRALNLNDRAVVVANPIPEDEQIDPTTHDRVLHSGLAMVETNRIHGKAVTPFLLEHFHTTTGGESLRVNIRVVERNTELATQIAVKLSETERS